MISRRSLIGSSAVLLGAAAVSGRAQAAGIPEAAIATSPAMQPPLFPSSGPDYQPVVTLNGWTLPWRMNGDWKEFHLVAEPVRARNGAGHEGASVGLQRAVAGADHRMRRRRQGPHLRHQQAARAHHGALARHAGAERHGRRRRPHAAADQAGQDLRLRVRDQAKAAPSCTTRTPTKWCRWRWA